MTTSRTAETAADTELDTIPLVWIYHSIAAYDEDPYEVTMTPDRFERQMRWLRHRGLRGVSMSELLDAQAKGRARGMVGLTFDDGYRDFRTTALPILRRYSFTATVFVLYGRLGGDNEWSRPGPVKALLSADEVREIDRSGMEIGSHGLKHLSLVHTTDAALRAETLYSRHALEELVDHEVRGFCYPYGHLDGRVVGATREAGYDYACAVTPSPFVGRHALPRTLVHDRDTSWRLDAKRLVWKLTVGNRRGVRHHQKGQ